MKITTQLVKHLCEQLGLDKKHLDASTRVDSEVAAFVGEQLASGKLGLDVYKSLTVELETKAIDARFAAIEQSIGSVASLVAKHFEQLSTKATEATPATKPEVATETKAVGSADLVKAATEDSIRVKAAVEMYSHNPTVLTYAKSTNANNRNTLGDAPVVHPWGGEMEAPTQRTKAVSGAWLKHMVARDCRRKGIPTPRGMEVTEHDRQLINWAVDNCAFVGPIGNRNDDEERCDHEFKGQKVANGLHKKALLDDSASGGLEAVPIEFDSLVVMAPLLNGELFPFVDFQQASRRRMEGYKFGEFTFGNAPEGTAITPFTTTSFISAFDTTINTITGACDVGLDFLDDSPADIGTQITNRWGEGFLKEMDRQIAIGSGTGEMLGLLNTSGLVSPSAGSGSLPYVVDDVESLQFAVPKQFRERSGQRAVYLSNDTVYRRFRAIKVGTSDQRRIFEYDYQNYMTGGYPHRIQEGIANTVCGYFCLNYFRGYRRAGYSVNVVGTTDRDNALKNQQTIVVRARYGGQLSLAAAGAVIDDLPTS